mmetsp:Transcript_37754/g.84167  ORF Transcript_37754/g.84167 Transcript_37754/m.84167 type:complete len:227 (-) Transcript_37754:193-873(-)
MSASAGLRKLMWFSTSSAASLSMSATTTVCALNARISTSSGCSSEDSAENRAACVLLRVARVAPRSVSSREHTCTTTSALPASLARSGLAASPTVSLTATCSRLLMYEAALEARGRPIAAMHRFCASALCSFWPSCCTMTGWRLAKAASSCCQLLRGTSRSHRHLRRTSTGSSTHATVLCSSASPTYATRHVLATCTIMSRTTRPPPPSDPPAPVPPPGEAGGGPP